MEREMRGNWMLARSSNAACLILLLFLGACAVSTLDFAEELTFDPVKIPTDFDDVMQYAERSKVAYATPDIIRQRYPNTIRVAEPANTKVQYFLEVSPTDKTQTISIRGTANFLDVIRDAEIIIEESVRIGIPVHTGFRRLTSQVFEDVKPYLRKEYRTRLTGHSLGAVIAAILMLYLQDDGFLVDRAINFGQPKFTTAQGVNRFKDLPLQRIVDSNDVVPLLPPRLLRHPVHGAYEHIGEEIILLDGVSYIHLNEHDSTRISVGSFWRNMDQASLQDHKMDRYLARIKAKQRAPQLVDYRNWRQHKQPTSPN